MIDTSDKGETRCVRHRCNICLAHIAYHNIYCRLWNACIAACLQADIIDKLLITRKVYNRTYQPIAKYTCGYSGKRTCIIQSSRTRQSIAFHTAESITYRTSIDIEPTQRCCFVRCYAVRVNEVIFKSLYVW